MEVIKGETLNIKSKVYLDVDQRLLANCTGSTSTMMVKAREGDSDASAIITKAGSISDGPNGEISFSFSAAETLALPSYHKVVFEIVVKLADGTFIRTGVDDLYLLSNVLKTLF